MENKDISEMSYSELCEKTHSLRRSGNIDGLDMFAVEIACKMDGFRQYLKEKERECKELWEEIYK